MSDQIANAAMGSVAAAYGAALAGALLVLHPVPALAHTRIAADVAPAEPDASATSASGAPAPSAEPAPAAAPAADAPAAGSVPVPAPPPGVTLPPVEPIIPDAEFNAAIPPLTGGAPDPQLDQPLESIDAFDRRVAAEQAVAAANGSATPAAPTTPTTPTAASAITPIPPQGTAAEAANAAELAKPLPPLDQFQVEPVQIAQPEQSGKAAPLRYAVKVTGLAEADKQTDTNLASEFEHASELHDGKGKAANLAMVSARLTDDSALLQRILASEGWYEASVRTRIDQGEAADSTAQLTAVLEVTPGRRYTLATITLTHPPTVPPDLVERNFALRVGEPIVAARVQGAEAQVAVALPQNGYPFVKLGDRDILLDPATGGGDYTLPVDPGQRAKFGDVATRGTLAFDARHVGVLARFKRGELYDSRKVDDLRQALVATGLFATVGVEPLPTAGDAGDGTRYTTVMVDQTAGPPRTIAGTAGYGSGEGFKLQASWTHRNLFPPEGALIVTGTAGTMEQGAGVSFRRSNAGRRDRTFETGVEALHSNYDAYSAYTGRLYARLSRDSTPLWQKRITWAVGAQLLGTREQSYDFAAAADKYRTYYVAGVSGQLELDTSDSLLNPTRGFRVTTLVEPEGSVQGGFTPYVRVRLDASGYVPASDSFVLAGRVRVGTIQGASLDDLAPSRRFYAGGGGSVRGFAYEKLGPLDPKGDPIGGRSVIEGSAEVRYRFGNYGLVGFLDAGQSYTTSYPGFSNIRYGIGVGGRFYTNFGPFRLDVATPLGRRPGESRFNVYISIGQAF